MSVSGIPGIIGWVGYAKEATWGTPVTPATVFIPVTAESLERKRAEIAPTLIAASRDAVQQFRQGQQTTGGNIQFPLFPDAGMDLVASGFGMESETTGSTPTSSTTLASAAIAAATTISTTATFTANDIIQIGAAGTGAELKKVVGTPSGTGPYTVTLDTALVRGHLNGATVAKVVAPYTHTIATGSILNSYTLEKLLQTATTSLQYSGMAVDKLSVKIDNKGEIKVQTDFVGMDEVPLSGGSISTYAGPTSSILAFPDVTISLGAVAQSLVGGTFTADTDLESCDWGNDNGLKPDYTLSTHLYPTRLIPTERKQTLKVTRYYKGTTFRSDFDADTAISLKVSALNGSGYGLVLAYPELHFKSWLSQLKVGAYLDETADFTVKKNATVGASAQMQIINSTYPVAF